MHVDAQTATMTPSTFDPRPVTLEGQHVRLEPLAAAHAAALCDAGRDASIWQYLPRPPFLDVADTEAWIGAALAAAEAGSEVAFAIVDRATGRAVGSTRYLCIRREHRGLEIGWTWIAPAFQRTPVNTECKLLLLTHAFETLGAMRVEFKTDLRNERSQRALERIGGVREGVFRRHMLVRDGHVRDSVYYSIVDGGWPAVKARLRERLKPAVD